MSKKIISLFLVIVMLMGLAVPAMATESTPHDISTGALAITEGGTYTVTGTSTTNNITVAADVTATITLKDVSIKFSDGSGVSGGDDSNTNDIGTAAIDIGAGANVTLILEGRNTLQGGDGRAAIEVSGNKKYNNETGAIDTGLTPANLTIQGSGSLNATSGNAAAAIGGGFGMNAGNITIEGGNITATAGGGDSGAGIGGGHAGDRFDKAYGSFGSITITGGVIVADGVRLGAGIGAGAHGNCEGSTITITGGVITAKGGTFSDWGDGIGLAHGGSGKTPPTVTISGNVVVVASSINAKNSSAGASKTTITGGLILNGSTCTMYDDVTLSGDLTLATGKNVAIPAGKTLTVPTGVTLTVNGEISGEGTVLVKGGTVVNENNITCTYVPGDYIMTLTAEPDVQTYNQQILLTATVTKYADGSLASDLNGKEVSFTYGETTIGTAELSGGVATLEATVNWAAGDYTVKASVLDPNDIPVNGKVAVTVNKADQTVVPAAPTAADNGIEYGSITLNAVTGEGHGTVQYAYVEKPAEGEAEAPTNWQTSTTLTGLKAGTTYIVYARFGGNEYYNPSAAGAGAEIATAAMETMTAPVLPAEGHTVGYKTITLAAPADSTVYSEATVEYRMSSDNGTTWGEWQSSADFSGLTAETAYLFQARYAITAYSHYSEASEAITLTTTATPKYNVSLRVIGASEPSETPSFDYWGSGYDYKGAEYQNWLKTTAYEVYADTTAKGLIEAVLVENGFTYSFDNYGARVWSPEAFGAKHELYGRQYGRYSYWYITVYNGGEEPKTESFDYENYVLQDGDQVIFHYTFQYQYETTNGSYKYNYPEIVQKYLQVLDLTPEETAAVENVEALIAAIGRVTPDSGDAIAAARAAYDALTNDAKDLVASYETLTAAEEAFAEIGDASETPLPAPALDAAAASATLYSITLPAATVAAIDSADYTLFYSASADGQTWGVWQTSSVFEKLLPAKTYYFRAMAQTNDWTKYGDSEVSGTVTVTTPGGNVEATVVTTADMLQLALTTAATDGSLTVIDIQKDIVINDIYQDWWTATIPEGANILLTSSNGSSFFNNECHSASCIEVGANTTVTVRDMTFAILNHTGVPNAGSAGGNTPGNAWHDGLRFKAASAVINLDNVDMYNDSTPYGVVGDHGGTPGTLNIYSGAFRGLGYKVFKIGSAGTVNLIPTGDILVEGAAEINCDINLLPMLSAPVSGAAIDSGSYTAMSAATLTADTLTYNGGLRLNTNSATTVPPVALAAPVVAAADDENAATADVTYTVTNNSIVFTVDRDGKDNNALIQIQGSRLRGGYNSSFGDVIDDNNTGLTNQFTYTGLAKDTGYEVNIRYISLDGSYTDATTTVTVTTTFTPEVLTAPTLGDQVEKTETSITLTAPAGSAEDTTATVDYRISEDGERWGEWQASTVFEGLNPGTTYYFQARYKAVHKYWLNSEASGYITVTTKAPALTAPVLSAEGAASTAFTVTLAAPAASAEDAGATFEYRMSTDGQTWGDWQQSNVFEDLTANTTYYFQARYIASSTSYMDSAESNTVTVATKADANAPMFVVKSVDARPGNTITVDVEMKNNPGIISAVLEVSYDQNKLELVGVEDKGLLPNATFSETYATYPYVMGWEDSTASADITADGVLATLTFKVKDTCQSGDQAVISLSYEAGNVYNKALDDVAFDAVAGTVSISEHTWGEPTYEWNDDYSQCTATRVCTDDECDDYTQTETVNSTYVTTPATEDEDGETVYTADFVNPAFETQTYTKVLPAVKAKFVVSEVTGCVGEEVKVTVSVVENPGIIAAKLTVDYDSDKLTLVGAENGTLLTDATFGNSYSADPYVLEWNEANQAENITDDGVLATLTFKVKDTCAAGDEAAIAISAVEAHSTEVQDVEFRTAAGGVTVTAHDWSEVEYKWADDYSTVTASRECGCGEIETETVNATHEHNPASCSEEGSDVYTSAEFVNPAFTKQIHTEVREKLPHTDITVSGGDTATIAYVCDCGHNGSEVVSTSTPVITVSEVYGGINEEITVEVSVANNPGFASMVLNLDYDEAKVTLVKAESTVEGFARDGKVITLGSYDTVGGVVFTLTFKATTEQHADIKLSYRLENVVNSNEDTVLFAIDNGRVSAVEYVLGDVNDDGAVNIKDVTILRRHLADWEGYESIVELAADVDCNGVVEPLDVTILRRFLAEWEGVTLG